MSDSSPIADRILSWYALNKRDLPWRRTRNPYFIWVSEIMLQQTQVQTVIPYYHRFLKKFPTLDALAEATLQEVLKVWEDMGYYARARHLHAAAREMATQGGRVPQTWEELIRLPGVGTYTASAVLNFAFDQRLATLDSNARRVLCRLFAVGGRIDQGRTQREIHKRASEMIPAMDPAHFNQGMMELGATLCRPRNPSCDICPVQDFCLAFKRGLQDKLPVTKKRRPLAHKELAAAIIQDARGRLLLVQRPNHGLLGGLWKLPGGERRSGETLPQGLRRRVREELGVGVRVAKAVVSVRHAYTHFRITLHGFPCVLGQGRPRVIGCSSYQWASHAKVQGLPISRADRKVIESLRPMDA